MKKLLWMLASIGVGALVYYLFIRSFEFEVNLSAKTLPGDVVNTIRIWNRSLENAKPVIVDSLEQAEQTIVRENRRYSYRWRFTMVNDSVTKVNIRIAEHGKGLKNKLLIPFTAQPIEKDAEELVREFYRVLQTHLEITKVNVVGETVFDSVFCACSSLQTAQIDKAKGMMKDFPLLTSFVNEFNLTGNGHPIVRIKEWNHSAGTLKFDFCFPINKYDSLPVIDEIHYEKLNRQPVVMAEFNGNYITSDRAWYALLQYAKQKGYKLNGLPIERFHDNPNTGMNEREWKADVYLPIQKN